MMTYTIVIDGIKFSIHHEYDAQILLDEADPIDDKTYRKALKKAIGFLKHLNALWTFENIPEDASPSSALLVIEAYKLKYIDVSERVYRLAVDLMNGKHISHYDYPELLPAWKKPRAPKPVVRDGYVYLMKGANGTYKIGRSKNPIDRMKMFGVHLPFEIEPVCIIKSEDHVSLEKELHAMFADFRVNGEWFKLADDDVEYIKSLAVKS